MFTVIVIFFGLTSIPRYVIMKPRKFSNITLKAYLEGFNFIISSFEYDEPLLQIGDVVNRSWRFDKHVAYINIHVMTTEFENLINQLLVSG